MDNIRLILLLALSFVLLMLWQAWQFDYGELKEHAPQQQATAAPADQEQGVPTAPIVAAEPVKSAEVPVARSAPEAERVQVKTDLLDVEISTQGGDIQSVNLLDYPISLDQTDETFQLLRPEPPNLFIAQSGLIGGQQELAPTHQAIFSAEAKQYALDQGQNDLTVKLTWSHPNGVTAAK